MKSNLIIAAISLFIQTPALANWKVGVNAGYSPNYLVTLKGDGVSSGHAYSVNYELEYAGAADFGLEIWNTPKDSWGFISGFQYGGERELKSGTVNGFSLNVGGASSLSKYRTHFIYLGTAYRWSSFYIPVAISYGFTKFTPSASSLDAGQIVITENGPGFQTGMGWFLGENFVIEYAARIVTTSMSITDGANSEKTKGLISSAFLNLKLLY